jgi:predicted dehydrogenase
VRGEETHPDGKADRTELCHCTQHRFTMRSGWRAFGVAEIAVPWWREQAYYNEPGRGTYARDGGGVFISQAIQALDLALTLAGPVSKVQAMARTSR